MKLKEIRYRYILIFCLLINVMSGCGSGGNGGSEGSNSGSQNNSSPPSLSLLKKVTITTDAEGGSARPEIIATANRVFVVYL
ncbi:MAG: hypothetical protein HZC10_04670, partial [Nitrospirae bacterium]|nr:hypothetical protein [Nitrospirota bacterium]